MAKRIEFDDTAAEAEQKVLESVPGATIPILAGPSDITGGTKTGHVNALGPEILVEVTDVYSPKGGAYDLGLSSRGWEWSKKIPLNTPVMLPEGVVRHIEGLSERNVKRIEEESAMYGNKTAAEAFNPGMRYVEGREGPFLLREFRRYIVRRVSAEEMRMRR